MQTFPFRLRGLSLLCLALVFLLTHGCGSKKQATEPAATPEDSQADTPSTKKKKKGVSKATQRPYVINGITYYPIPTAQGYQEQGIASWYGEQFHGKKTANGESYDMYGTTAAHKTLPMDTVLLVRNLENNKTTTVRINDRGPFVKSRIIDLTYTGASSLGMIGNGTAPVEIVALRSEREEVPPEPGKGETPKGEPGRIEPVKKPPVQDFDKGTFYVQIGAFIKLDNARKLARSFADRGRDVTIQQYPAAGMNLYRVMVFSGNSLKQAKQYEQYLEANGFPYAMVLAR